MLLQNKTAVITGASRGIGREIALAMAEEGANLAVLYAGNAELAQTVCEVAERRDVQARPYQCNVADYDACHQTVEQVLSDFGRVDILVNNAGITRDHLTISMTKEDFDDVLDVNLKGAFYMIKQVYRHFMKNKAGRIINISSVAGLMGNAGQANYAASKAGLVGLTKTIAKELAARNVTCNAIAPGFIETDMTAKFSVEILEGAKDQIPMKRFGSARDVANLAVFLASDLAGYLTGTVIQVDGGLYI